MRFGLSSRDEGYIVHALANFPAIEKVIIFGSRAMGNNEKGSDVDMAVVGKNITPAVLVRLRSLLNEELPLPYFFDVVHYERIKNENIKRHIDKEGKDLFCKIE
jgi:predicted nucleotidyltransferase